MQFSRNRWPAVCQFSMGHSFFYGMRFVGFRHIRKKKMPLHHSQYCLCWSEITCRTSPHPAAQTALRGISSEKLTVMSRIQSPGQSSWFPAEQAFPPHKCVCHWGQTFHCSCPNGSRSMARSSVLLTSPASTLLWCDVFFFPPKIFSHRQMKKHFLSSGFSSSCASFFNYFRLLFFLSFFSFSSALLWLIQKQRCLLTHFHQEQCPLCALSSALISLRIAEDARGEDAHHKKRSQHFSLGTLSAVDISQATVLPLFPGGRPGSFCKVFLLLQWSGTRPLLRRLPIT